MILVDKTIKEQLNNESIKISPYNPSQLGPSSYDIRLSNNFMVFDPQLEIIDPYNLNKIMKEYYINYNEFFVLHPNQFVLGSSIESFTLNNHIVGQINGKSSLARLGLQIHATAGFFDPGWNGVATLELSNVSPIPIRLYPGMLIGQMVFIFGSNECDRPYGDKELNSKYQNAKTVQSSLYKEGE